DCAQKRKSRYEVFSPDQPDQFGVYQATNSTGGNGNKKRNRKIRNGNGTVAAGSPHGTDYADYYGIGGPPSHGTLASVPVETLKRQRSTKKKKKKKAAGRSHHTMYNSDDELM